MVPQSLCNRHIKKHSELFVRKQELIMFDCYYLCKRCLRKVCILGSNCTYRSPRSWHTYPGRTASGWNTRLYLQTGGVRTAQKAHENSMQRRYYYLITGFLLINFLHCLFFKRIFKIRDRNKLFREKKNQLPKSSPSIYTKTFPLSLVVKMRRQSRGKMQSRRHIVITCVIEKMCYFYNVYRGFHVRDSTKPVQLKNREKKGHVGIKTMCWCQRCSSK